MANRETENYRSSVQQVIKQPSRLMEAMATIGQKIIAEGQEAKINENFSKAQLDLQKLNQQYQIDYEGNPFGGMEELKAKRDEIFSAYGEQISPFFRKGWQDTTRQLAMKDDANNEAWAYTQTKKNTVRSINESIKNNMSQATLDGQNYGNSDQDDIGTMMNFAQSKRQLAGFGDKHLGGETTTALLEDYDGDYLKSFISGVSEANPLKALSLMDRPEVKGSFKDQNQYLKMKEAVENRALNVQKINGEKQVLNVLKDENNLLTKSLTDNVSYADLQKAFSSTKMGAEAQSFFMRANGYTKDDQGETLSPAEKMKTKAALYSDMTQLMAKENMTSEEVAGFQDRIYGAMNSRALDEKEGASFLNQLVAPLIDQKEQQFQTYSQDSWISPDVGFGGVQEMFEQQVKIQPAEGEKKVGALTEGINNENKVKLYDYYYSALQERAESYGVPVANIKSLNKPQQRKLYAEAQADAMRNFKVDQNPALSTLNDLPNQTFSGGKLIQGASGDRNLKPDVTVAPKYETYMGSDNFIYRKYPNGKYERVGAAPKGQK